MTIDASKPKELLLVEDSDEDIFFFKRALNKSGVVANLHVAKDGSEALRFLSENTAARRRPDIVFLDLKLPKMNGFDVLQWIRGQNFRPALRVIVLSGSPRDEDKAAASELGSSGYEVKPITVEVLRSHLSKAGTPQ